MNSTPPGLQNESRTADSADPTQVLFRLRQAIKRFGTLGNPDPNGLIRLRCTELDRAWIRLETRSIHIESYEWSTNHDPEQVDPWAVMETIVPLWPIWQTKGWKVNAKTCEEPNDDGPVGVAISLSYEATDLDDLADALRWAVNPGLRFVFAEREAAADNRRRILQQGWTEEDVQRMSYDTRMCVAYRKLHAGDFELDMHGRLVTATDHNVHLLHPPR